MGVYGNSLKRVRAFQIELEFGSAGFSGEGKTAVPGEKPLGARERTNNKLNPHMASAPGFEPWPHWGKESALTTATPLLPCSFSRLQILYSCKQRNTLPILQMYTQLVIRSMEIEKQIVFDDNNLDSFRKKWASFKQLSNNAPQRNNLTYTAK